jgi:hypothetical protein
MNVMVITPQTEPMAIKVIMNQPPENSDTVSLCESWSSPEGDSKRRSNRVATEDRHMTIHHVEGQASDYMSSLLAVWR